MAEITVPASVSEQADALATQAASVAATAAAGATAVAAGEQADSVVATAVAEGETLAATAQSAAEQIPGLDIDALKERFASAQPDENGNVADELRIHYLRTHFAAAHRAIQMGVPLAGYFVWSLLDNFEWSSGWWPKFGLIAVDRKTLKRTVRPSAAWLADKLVELRGLDDSRRTLHAVEPDPRLKKPSSRLH